MAQAGIIANFRNMFAKFQNLDLKRFYRDNLGVSGLKFLEPTIIDIKEKFRRAEKSIEKLSDNQVNQLITLVNGITLEIEKTFAYDDNTFRNLVLDTQNKINAQNNNLLNFWPQIVAIMNDRPDIEDISQELEKKLRNINLAEKEILEYKENLENKINSFDTLKLADERLSELQIDTQSKNYLSFADISKKGALKWLKWGIIPSGMILLGVLFLFLFGDPPALPDCLDSTLLNNVGLDEIEKIIIYTNSNFICSDYHLYSFFLTASRSIVLRGMIIGLLSYIFFTALKNYNALMHNYITNSQRGNSLGATQVLLSKNTGEQGKIIDNSLKSIFEQQETGYTKTEEIKNIFSVAEKIVDLGSKIK